MSVMLAQMLFPEIWTAVRNNPPPVSYVRLAEGGPAQVSCSISEKVIKYLIFMRIKAMWITDYNHTLWQ